MGAGRPGRGHDRPAVFLKGCAMPKLKIDNPFFRFMGKLGDIIILNLVWLLFSLPVITAGASSTALFYVARKIAAKEDYRVFHDFKKSFRQNFKEATIAWVILLILGALAAADLVIGMGSPGAAGNIFRGIGVALCLVWLMEASFVFALLARYEYALSRLLLNAFFFGLRNFPATVALLALALWFPLLIWRAPEVALYLAPVWLLTGGALTALAVSAILLPAYKKLEGPVNGGEE